MHAHITIFILIFALFANVQKATSQCPGASDCSGADILCSIDALNGFTCNNPVGPNGNFPTSNLCHGVGVPHNLSWWGFFGAGGVLSLTFNVNLTTCEAGNGIQAGVFEGHCDGSNVWDCNVSCNTNKFTFTGATIPCAPYYIWVDGCKGDVCTFTISVNGSGGAPLMPPLPPLMTKDRVCPCATFEVCAPNLGDCEPTHQWTIDGVLQSERDDCISIDVNEFANPGDRIDVCLIATIGNPDYPRDICDQDQVCSQFIIEPILSDTIPCETVCYENAPLDWHGLKISSSCIVPPCSTRITDGPDDCCLNLVKPWIILPAPNIGIKDTIMCNQNSHFKDENGQSYSQSTCGQLVEFKVLKTNPHCTTTPVGCDTSYELNLSILKFTSDWKTQCDSCQQGLKLFNKTEYQGACIFHQGLIETKLIWFNKDSTAMIDTTIADSFIYITTPGTYCVKIFANYRGSTCQVDDPECFEVTSEILKLNNNISGPTKVCEDSISSFSVDSKNNLCAIQWSLNGQGTRIGQMDSTIILIKWDSLTLDTTQVCANIKTNCSEYQLCKEVFICPHTTYVFQISQGEIYYSFPTQQLFWKGLNSSSNKNQLSIYDIQGHLILKKKIFNQGEINLNLLSKGIYLIHLNNDENLRGRTLKIMR